MFPIYIAGSWTNREDMKSVIDKFTNLGYTITHDWTVVECDNIESRSEEQKIHCAVSDINGVKNAVALVVIMDNPKYAYRGTNCEIGCALGLDIPVYLYNPLKVSYATSNIFYWHKDIKKYDSLETLIQDLGKLNPRLDFSIDGNQAKENANNYRIKNNDDTLNLIQKLISQSSSKGYNKFNFKLKNKRHDVKFLTDELTKLNFVVSSENNVIKISWE